MPWQDVPASEPGAPPPPARGTVVPATSTPRSNPPALDSVPFDTPTAEQAVFGLPVPIRTDFRPPVLGAMVGSHNTLHNTLQIDYADRQPRTVPFLAPPRPLHSLVGRDSVFNAI